MFKPEKHCRALPPLPLFQLDSTVHVHLDEKRLAGYWNACKSLTEDRDSDSQTTHYNQINSLIRTRNYPVRARAPFNLPNQVQVHKLLINVM